MTATDSEQLKTREPLTPLKHRSPAQTWQWHTGEKRPDRAAENKADPSKTTGQQRYMLLKWETEQKGKPQVRLMNAVQCKQQKSDKPPMKPRKPAQQTFCNPLDSEWRGKPQRK
jgi:hypothetical protein